MQRIFTSISEPIADFKWQKLFFERWPAYKAWLYKKGTAPDTETALNALRKFMPKMVDTHRHLCDLVRADDAAICFLTGFQPPVYYNACSQVVSTRGIIQLVRNYDYHPYHFEGTLLMTAWNGKKVIASSDCLMGALDGMNEDGLAVSLAFGGRKTVGYGFGIPFILRYILEFCSNVDEAVEVLLSVPSHMSYNVTVTDKTGTIRTIQITPDRSAVVTAVPFGTNHLGSVYWAENADFNKSDERAEFLNDLLTKEISPETFVDYFMYPPLYNTHFEEGLGTLYTAAYYPTEGAMQLRWPNDSMYQSFENFNEESKLIEY